MTGRQALIALAALTLGSAPAFAQAGQPQGQAAAAAAHEMGPEAMICSMGMLPHPGMGMGMANKGAGGMMQHGAAAGGMQHGAAAGAAKQDSAGRPAAAAHAAGGMQHGAAGGMQHGAAGQAGAHAMGDMNHPVTPTMLIHHAQDLGLTAEQQGKIAGLAKTSQAACEQHLDAAAGAHKAAAALLDRDAPDLAAYQAKLRETTDHLVQGHLAVVRAGLEARGMLTPDQVAKLKK